MKQLLTPLDGSWDQYLTLFAMFDRAKVPTDSRWRSLLLYFREIKDYNHLTDAQKVDIQKLMTEILEKKDFTDKHLDAILKKYHAVIAKPYQSKVEALLREADDVISGFQTLLSARCGDINTLEEESVTIVVDECETTEPIEKLRTAFSKVKALLESDIRNLESMATIDGVTKIANRRGFDLFMEDAVGKWLHESRPLCMAMLDIDHFKRFNDEHGHRIGDQVLAVVGSHLKKAVEGFSGKNNALAARYGGEEFALVVSGPDADTLRVAAEECRDRIKKFNFLIRDAEGNVVESGLHITVSAGVASASSNWKGAYIENLIDNADKALYFAKQSGRDRAVLFNPDEASGFSLITAK
ncbi:GGDEF domain-containing protein [Desulfovibrio sp. OttesenSCG-928-O18]|nr:GGDEF domain-containing protein [Desulfovibrio sp. OttesenSCG-928-O18]